MSKYTFRASTRDTSPPITFVGDNVALKYNNDSNYMLILY